MKLLMSLERIDESKYRRAGLQEIFDTNFWAVSFSREWENFRRKIGEKNKMMYIFGLEGEFGITIC